MLDTIPEVDLPNLKLFRFALLVALVLAFTGLFSLSAPHTPRVVAAPATFDAARAFADLQKLCFDYTSRSAGSDKDNLAAVWLTETLTRIGLEPHIESFAASINGKHVALQNVWAESRGDYPGTIIVLANRDSPPGSTQGANNNASGVAIALETARTFFATTHRHSIVYLFTDGDAYGALGARDFVRHHNAGEIIAVVALRKVGLRDISEISVDGWSSSGRVAPPWLWALAGQAGRTAGGLPVDLPGTFAQVTRLAMPFSSGSQAPFVSAGIPAITLTAKSAGLPPIDDTIATVSTETLTRIGATVQTIVEAIDAGPQPNTRSGDTVFLTRHRQLPGWVLQIMVMLTALPLAAVTFDLVVRGRKRKRRLGPAWLRLLAHLAPWLIALLAIYVAALFSLFPRIPGAVIPPESGLSHHPRYFRIIVLLLLLALAYHYARAIERRLTRRVQIDAEAMVAVAHITLLAIVLLVFSVNPLSVLIFTPALVLWPHARPGQWQRSLLPVWLGLAGLAGALLFFGLQLHLSYNVWWYFFLLVENHNVPVSVALLGIVFLAATDAFGWALHNSPSQDGEPRAPILETDWRDHVQLPRRLRSRRTPRVVRPEDDPGT